MLGAARRQYPPRRVAQRKAWFDTMKCPICGCNEDKVLDTRPIDDERSIRRRRECLSCKKRFTTYETVVGFLLGTFLGTIIAIMLWWSKFLEKVTEPYLVVLNSLPKVALRTSNNYLGREWHACYNSYGNSNFFSSNNT